MLSVLLFLHEYCWYYILPFASQVNYFCDNLEVVNKMRKLIENEQYYDEYINTVNHDAMYLLKQYLPCNFNIQHVRSHQDKKKPESTLIIAEKLNI